MCAGIVFLLEANVFRQRALVVDLLISGGFVFIGLKLRVLVLWFLLS